MIEIQIWQKRLEALSEGGIVQAFIVTAETTFAGGMITCYCRNRGIALALRDLINTNSDITAYYSYIIENGKEFHNVQFSIEN